VTAEEIRNLSAAEKVLLARRMQLYGNAPRFLASINDLFLLAGYDVTVLIEGETGTGKELFARGLHELGPRSTYPFVSVNCASLPAELLESEFFGHTRGAYTSAYTYQRGLVAEADHGTLFLDEIASLDGRLQSKLLRFLQTRDYRPLGSVKMQTADLRVVAASNTPLQREAQTGNFRWDLYYRLAVFVLRIPRLAERAQDILPLAEQLLTKHAANLRVPVPKISREVADVMAKHDWGGNVRELENVVQHVLLRCQGDLVKMEHLPDYLSEAPPSDRPPAPTFQGEKAEIVLRFEREYLSRLLATHGGNLTHAARAAGKDRRALFALLKKHNLHRLDFLSSGPAGS